MNTNNIKFRKVKREDIASIMTIEYSSFSEVICEAVEVFEERIRVFSNGFKVMEYQNEMIGYICSEIWDDLNELNEDFFTLGHSISELHNEEGTQLYISSMGLLPRYRNQGLGRMIFEDFMVYIKEMFPKIESVVLIVSEKWAQAIKIYESNGFLKKKTFSNFFNYEDDKKCLEDALVMVKIFNS